MSKPLAPPSTFRVSDPAVARTAQGAAFVAAIVIFPLCLMTAARLGTSPFEIFAGVMLGGILSIALVVLGMVIPLAFRDQG